MRAIRAAGTNELTPLDSNSTVLPLNTKTNILIVDNVVLRGLGFLVDNVVQSEALTVLNK